MSENEDLITAAEAARMLGLTRQRVSAIAHTGKLGRQIANRYYVFTRAEVEAYAKRPKDKGGRPKSDLSLNMKYEAPSSVATNGTY